MNLVIIGHFSADAKVHIRASFPAEWDVVMAEPDHAGLYLQDADALIPEHVLINASFLDKAPRLRMIQTGAGYGEDRAVCFSGQHGQEGSFTKRS